MSLTKFRHIQYYQLFYLFIVLFYISDLLSNEIASFKYVAYFFRALTTLSVLFLIRYNPKLGKVLFFIALFFLFLLVRGLYLNNWSSYIYGDTLIFSSITFLIFFPEKDSVVAINSKIFYNILAGLLLIGIPLSWYYIIKLGLKPPDEIGQRFNFSEAGNVSDSIFWIPILYAPLLMPFATTLKKTLRNAVFIATGTLLIIGIFSATRVLILFTLSAFLVYLIQNKLWERIFSKSFLKSFIVLVVLIIGIVNYYGYDKIVLGIDNSYGRFFNQKAESLTTGRMEELKSFINGFNSTEYWLGRGLGGSHSFTFWREVQLPHGIGMAHIGFLNLVLKGGLILMILIYGMSIYSIIRLYKSGDRKFCYAIFLYLLYDLSITVIGNFFFAIILFSSISFAFATKEITRYDV